MKLQQFYEKALRVPLPANNVVLRYILEKNFPYSFVN